MKNIIPVVNAASFDEVMRKIRQLEPIAEWAHIDVADGSFTENVLWHNPKELLNIKTPLFLEMHLMLDHIDEKISDWLQANVRRNIIHVEAARDLENVMHVCHEADIEAGIALKPETPCSMIAPYFKEADLIQLLAVTPGKSGDTFREETIQKITEVRHMSGTAVIEIDGGVNVDVVKRASAAGANLFAAGHILFAAPDMRAALAELEKYV